MSTDDPIDWFQLSAYFAGECTAEERDALEQWIGGAPERRRLIQRLRVVWEARTHRPVIEYGRDDAIAYVMAMIRRERDRWRGHDRVPRGARRGSEHVRGYTWPRVIWPTVAILVLAIVVAVVNWSPGVNHLTRRTARSTLTYTTGNGQRATITLSDGSTVALDVASRLEVPADYVTGHRTVRLTGAGLFTVSHQRGAPFTVIAGSTEARVLGTSFLVRHYTTDSVTTVAVRDGKVAVRSVILTAAREVVVGRAGVGPVESADPAQFSFATGVLKLDGVPFPEAITELDRWYDADIRLGDPALATRRVAGEYAAGSLADLADILAGTFDVRVVRHGRVLTLFSR